MAPRRNATRPTNARSSRNTLQPALNMDQSLYEMLGDAIDTEVTPLGIRVIPPDIPSLGAPVPAAPVSPIRAMPAPRRVTPAPVPVQSAPAQPTPSADEELRKNMERILSELDAVRWMTQRTLTDFDCSVFDSLAQQLRAAAKLDTPVASPVVSVVAPSPLAPVPDTSRVIDAIEPPPVVVYTVAESQLAEFAMYKDRDWSNYQKTVFHWVKYSTGSAQIDAVAGSGKTTTIMVAADFMRGDILFCAFNTHIKKEIERKTAGKPMTVKTIHAIGYAALNQYMRVRGKRLGNATRNKYEDQCKRAMQGLLADLRISPNDKGAVETIAQALTELTTSKVRVSLTDPNDHDAMRKLCTDYSIAMQPEWESAIFKTCARILDWGIDEFVRYASFDFTDMIWLPCALDLPMERKYDWVVVDECQDLSLAQHEIVARSLKEGGRLLAVGDPYQAIYRFAGASAASFEQMRVRFKCVQLKLSICYRCPVAVIELAQQDVPHIEAAPGAPQGEVVYMKQEEALKALKTGDLVLCRLTAPLVALCMRLLAEQKAAKVRGKDVGEQIAKTIKDVESFYLSVHGMQMPWESFGDALAGYQDTMLAKLSTKKNAVEAITKLDDKCEALRCIYENWHAKSADELVAQIKSLFYDEERQEEKPAIALSTVHRAKGLEEGVVFIYRPGSLPLTRKGQTAEDYQQEINLRYVARTRAMEKLVIVEEEKAA